MPSKYDPETRAKAVRLVLEHREDYPSEWAAITAVSKRLGMNAETLRNWIRKQQVDDGQREGVTSEAAAEIKALKRRNAELDNHRNPEGGNVFFRAGERPAHPPLTSSVCAFIAENKDRFGVAPICRVLTGHGVQIAPRTFYAWVSRAPSKRSLWDAAITEVLAGFYEPAFYPGFGFCAEVGLSAMNRAVQIAERASIKAHPQSSSGIMAALTGLPSSQSSALLGALRPCVDGVGLPTLLATAAVRAVSADGTVQVVRACASPAPSKLLSVTPQPPAVSTTDRPRLTLSRIGLIKRALALDAFDT